MKVIGFYKALLESLGIYIEDDQLYTGDEESHTPISVTNKESDTTLVVLLPSEAKLKKTDWSNAMAYHPVVESLLGGESTILKLTTAMVENKLHTTIQHIALSMVHLASNPKELAKCKLKTQELLEEVKTDSSTLEYLKKVISNSVSDPRLIRIKLGRGGTIDNVSYERTATLISPMLETADPLYGIKSTKGSQSVIRLLYESIIPRAVYGSNSKTAPYLTSMLTLYYNSAVKLNKIIDLLGKHCTTEKINTEWYSEIHNMADMLKELPTQYAGNSGLESKKKPTPPNGDIMSPGLNINYTSPVAQPQNQSTAQSPGSTGPTTVADAINIVASQNKFGMMQQQPMAMQHPMMMQQPMAMSQPMMMQQPMMFQMPPQQQSMMQQPMMMQQPVGMMSPQQQMFQMPPTAAPGFMQMGPQATQIGVAPNGNKIDINLR